MNTIEKLHKFLSTNLLGETPFFKFLWEKYASHHYHYVGIEKSGMCFSLFCDGYADRNGDFKPGVVAEFEVIGRPGMFEITSNTPMHPEARKSTQEDPLHAARLDAAGTLLGVLESDLLEFGNWDKVYPE